MKCRYWLAISVGGGWTEGLIVSYAASPSTGGAAGSIVVKAYVCGHVTFSTTVIVLPGSTGSDEVGRKGGERLLDAMAADLANIERQVRIAAIALLAALTGGCCASPGQHLDRPRPVVQSVTQQSPERRGFKRPLPGAGRFEMEANTRPV